MKLEAKQRLTAMDWYALKDKRNPQIPDHFILQFKGQKIYVEASPFMWIYPWHSSYPVQGDRTMTEHDVQFSLSLMDKAPNIACEFIKWDGAYLQLTKHEVDAHLMKWLAENGLEKLKAAIADYSEWRTGVSEMEKKWKAEDTAQDAIFKARGFKFRCNFSLHPEAGGDDQWGYFYTKAEMNETQVLTTIRKQGYPRGQLQFKFTRI